MRIKKKPLYQVYEKLGGELVSRMVSENPQTIMQVFTEMKTCGFDVAMRQIPPGVDPYDSLKK